MNLCMNLCMNGNVYREIADDLHQERIQHELRERT